MMNIIERLFREESSSPYSCRHYACMYVYIYCIVVPYTIAKSSKVMQEVINSPLSVFGGFFSVES